MEELTMISLVLRFQSLEVQRRWFVLTTVTVFLFCLQQVCLFYWGTKTACILSIWPAKTHFPSPQETSKPPSPSGMEPTTHLAYRPSKS